jgi:formylglycine-generating enzyme required for sulfatase activity
MKRVAGWILVIVIIILYVLLFSFCVDTFAMDGQDSIIVSQNHTLEEVNTNYWIKNNFIVNWIKKQSVLDAFIIVIITSLFTFFTNKLKKKLSNYRKINRKKRSLKTEEDRYLDFIITENEKLTFQGFETQVRVPILLWDIYVPLCANVSGIRMREPDKPEKAENIPEPRNIKIQEAVQLASDKNYDGLVILGDPGAGKTTLLKYFLLCFAKKEAAKRLNLPGDFLPVLLPLRSVDMKQTFIEAVCEQFRGYGLKLKEEFFINRLEDGKGIVLFDGLDEVADEKTRKKMCDWIHKVRIRFNKCPFIITSRFAGYRGDVKLPGTYLELSMLDFSKNDIRQFLHSWYTAVETSVHEDTNQWRTSAQKSAEELYGRIEGSKAYLDLAVNPLMLQLIALVHYDFKTIPDRRVELYERCIDLLLQKWDESKGLKTLLSAKEARQVLQPLALWMHFKKDRRRALQDEIVAQIKPQIQKVKPEVDAKRFLTSIRDRSSGVFVGYGTETFGFQHHSFQEYLTAEEIRNKNKSEILVKHFDESWWREPTLLAMGLDNPSIFESFMDKFMHSKKNDGAAADFMLKCVKEALVKSEEPFENALKNKGLDWQARYNGLVCLSAIGSDRAKDVVYSLKDDAQPEISNKARELLLSWGRIKEEEITEVDKKTGLIQRFFNSKEDNAEYILIPGGTYVMGALKKEVTVAPFYLAKFPVTNRLYRKFVKETGHRISTRWDDKRFNGDDQPVVGVSWDDVKAYCKWLTDKNKDKGIYRLPSEEEWEWAAGRGEREYPWGERIDHKRANYDEKVGHTTPVGSYPSGATPDGLMDMAGNVWEWTGSLYRESGSGYVLRGGSWGVDSGICPGLKLFTFILLPFVKILVNILKTYSIRNMTNK